MIINNISKNIFSILAILFVGCVSFPLDYYSTFYRVRQQEACEPLAINTQINIINTKGFMPVNVTNTWCENPIEFKFSKPSIDTDNKLINIRSCIIPQSNDPAILCLKMIGQSLFLKM